MSSEISEYLEFDWRNKDFRPQLLKPVRNLDNNDRKMIMRQLRDRIDKSDDAEIRNFNLIHDELFLEKFLYAREFNVEDSFELYKNWYWYRKRNPEVFRNFGLEASDIRKALENGLPGVLQQKDRKGRCILLLTGTNWDCSYSLLSIYRALLLSLEHLTNDIHNRANGFVVIVDWTGFSFRQSSNLKPSILRLMIEGLQDCYPARFKGVHFIGQPWYVDAALAVIVKTLLREEMKERIFGHGNNLSTLHELVHKDVLPADLGGEQPSYNPRSFLDTLLKAESGKFQKNGVDSQNGNINGVKKKGGELENSSENENT